MTFRNPPPAPVRSLELSPEALRAATEACTRYVIDHVESLAEQPSWDLEGASAVVARFREPLPQQGQPLEALLERIAAAVAKSYNTAGPGYLAYIPGGGLYPAALADYIAAAVNRYVGVWSAAPALVQMELQAIDWLRELVGYPAGARGILTSGGSISAWIGLVTARHERCGEEFQDAVLYFSEETHHSVRKAALLAGFRERHLRELPVDGRFRLRPDALREAVRADAARGLRPLLVVASAGTTNTGAIDPLPAIADVCEQHGLWLHVDGAYGGFFRMVESGFELIPGLERADSVVLDPHKSLFLPYGTGLLLLRDGEALRRTYALRASYMQDLEEDEHAVTLADISPELSRDFRGLRLWLPLHLFGIGAFRAALQEKLDLARWAHAELSALPGVECLDAPQLSVVAFRWLPPRGDADAFNARLLQRVHSYRRVFLSSTRIRGCFVLRLCVLSFRTHADRLAAALEDLQRAAAELLAESG